MSRIVLRGNDSNLLPLLTRLRLQGEHEITGIIPVGEGRDLELYTEISAIPLLLEKDWKLWRHVMDIIVTDSPLPEEMEELPQCTPQDCERNFLDGQAEIEADPMPEAEAHRDDPPSPAEPRIRFDFPGFAHELRREIRRSRRYHLGFCFTLFRIVNEGGDSLSPDKFLVEPLSSLPSRVGRKTDSWGISPEGILLHLAPEIQEQSRLLKRRLSTALEEQVGKMPGGPWRCQSAQALYPQDGERASELIRRAMVALARQS